jgi:putative cell wall-binding protein
VIAEAPGGSGTPVSRIGGADRFATGRQVSQAQWQGGKASAVVLARGDQAPDALAGVPLAAHVHGPLLLTDPAVLDSATRSEIDRVLGGPQTHKSVYILGGDSAVSPGIEAGLRNVGYTVVRYGGSRRFDTALKIAASFGTTQHVIVATGRDFPDALAAGPLGAAENAPIVLSDDTRLDAATAAFIGQHSSIDPVGGQAQRAVGTLNTAGKSVNGALAGADRYATGAAVAKHVATVTGHVPTAVGVASGAAFPDALTGGAYAANAAEPLLLTEPDSLPGPTAALLSTWAPQFTAVTVFGGHAAITDQAFAAIVKSVHGTAA